jgi:hypothetical protein
MHPANDLTSRIDEHGNLAVKCDPTRVALHAMYSPVGWASLAGAETWRLRPPKLLTYWRRGQIAEKKYWVLMPSYVEHLVLLKTKRAPSPEELARIQSLAKLPGVVFVAAGKNYTARGQGFNFGISVRFTSPEAEVAYQTHPEHVAVRDEVIKPLLDSNQAGPILAMDFEHTQPPKLVPLLVGIAVGIAVSMLAQRMRK